MTPERFAKGMTFDDYVKFTGSPANLGREGFDIRRFSLVRPRVDWSGFLRERHAKATDRRADGRHQVAGRAAGRPRENPGPLGGLVVRLPARRAVPGTPRGGRRPRAAHLRPRRRHDAAQGTARSRLARQRRSRVALREREERSEVGVDPRRRVLHEGLRRALPLRRVSGRLSQRPRDRSLARAARGRDGGGVEGAQRPRYRRAARLALRGCVGRRRNRRDPQRPPRAAAVESYRYGDVTSWSGSTV